MEHSPTSTRPNRAAIWAFLFAAISFYWALSGTLGLEMLGQGMKELALPRNPLCLLRG